MPLYTTDALILRTYKLGESDRIVVFLTRDRGKKRGVAKNARQSRRRFGGGLEPMTCGRVGYFERERRDLVRLDYVEQHYSFWDHALDRVHVDYTVSDDYERSLADFRARYPQFAETPVEKRLAKVVTD